MRARRTLRWLIPTIVLLAIALLLWIDQGGGPAAPGEVTREKAPSDTPPPRLEGSPLPSEPDAASTPAPAEPASEPRREVRCIVEGIVRDVAAGGVVPYVAVAGVSRTWNAGTRQLDQDVFRCETGRDGRFVLEATSYISDLTVAAPGWHVYDWHVEGDETSRKIDETEGAVTRLVLLAQKAYRLEGHVVDRHGDPLAMVRVGFTIRTRGFNRSVTLGSTSVWTDEEGAFSIGPIPEDPLLGLPEAAKSSIDRYSLVTFEMEGYATLRLDPSTVPAGSRSDWRVELPSGFVLAGVLLDEHQQPLADVAVAAEYGRNWELRRGTRTDEHGRWRLESLTPGPMVLSARAFQHDAKARREYDLDSDDLDVRLVAERIRLSTPPEIRRVLGLGLADVTDELRRAYDVPDYVNVLILDPGENPEALGIGRLERGFGLWKVGNDDATSVADAVERLIEITSSELVRGDWLPESCRVVYTFWNERMTGTNTQHVKITDEQRRDLETLLTELER